MRYRPFGASGKAVSAISLLLREAPNMTTPHAWRTLVFGAMECGSTASRSPPARRSWRWASARRCGRWNAA
uniref:Uncharacterized protein n=1 Tax=Phenylobacterium glaciei TaxID=2803784 RepID=A0A974SB80_9CAUL|nr:hypothetical protein JKL49_10905 [Phenylobacterium glaciei]